MKAQGMRVLRAKVSQNILSLYGLQIANYILPILVLPYLTRVLGIDNFGAYSIFFALMQYALIMVDFGFNFSATARIAAVRENIIEVGETFTAVTSIRLGFAVLASLLVFISLSLFENVRPWSGMGVLVATFAWCAGAAIFPVWLFQGLERMGFVTIFNLIGKITSTLLIFLLVRGPEDVTVVVAIYGFSSLMVGLVALLYSLRLTGPLRWPSVSRLVEEVRRGWPLFFTSLFSVVLTNSGVLLAGLFLSPAVVGGYAAVERLAKAANTLFQPITQAIFPRVSAVMSTSLSTGLQLAMRFAKPTLLGVLLVAMTLILLREQVVAAFSGEAYVEYAVALLPLGLWLIFGVVNNFAGIQILTTAGHARAYSRAFAFSGVVALALTILALPRIGYLAVPVGILLGEILLTVLLLSRVQRLRRNMAAMSGGEV